MDNKETDRLVIKLRWELETAANALDNVFELFKMLREDAGTKDIYSALITHGAIAPTANLARELRDAKLDDQLDLSYYFKRLAMEIQRKGEEDYKAALPRESISPKQEVVRQILEVHGGHIQCPECHETFRYIQPDYDPETGKQDTWIECPGCGALICDNCGSLPDERYPNLCPNCDEDEIISRNTAIESTIDKMNERACLKRKEQ